MAQGASGITRVLVVEDSPIMCKVLTSLLNADPEIIVVGTVYNGQQAVDVVGKLKPDIITMDMYMPVMDGFEATKLIMAHHPTPIVIISSSVFEGGMEKVFKAISYGALDVIDKGILELSENPDATREFISKLKFFSKIRVIHHPLGRLEEKQKSLVATPAVNAAVSDRIVAIAASTGGPQALLAILKSLPPEFPCGIVIVQHITKGFTEGLVRWLGHECKIKVKAAEDSEMILPGVAYIAPSDVHLKIEEGGKVLLSNDPPFEGHRPSANVLFDSVAKAYGFNAVGVILTGMGRDGAVGIRAMREAHAKTIAQDEATSVIFGMPKAAIDLGAIDEVIPLERIAEAVLDLVSARKK
jgi:two-component system chemotaxis response regulator CheB